MYDWADPAKKTWTQQVVCESNVDLLRSSNRSEVVRHVWIVMTAGSSEEGKHLPSRQTYNIWLGLRIFISSVATELVCSVFLSVAADLQPTTTLNIRKLSWATRKPSWWRLVRTTVQWLLLAHTAPPMSCRWMWNSENNIWQFQLESQVL